MTISHTRRAAVLARLSHLAAIRHIVLVPAGEDPVAGNDPAAIVSPIPFLRVDLGDGFCGPLWRLRLESSFTILARKRTLPLDPEDPSLLIRWAENRNGRPEPVACIDRRKRRLHLLVDVQSPTSPSEDAPSPEHLADQLIGNLFERLLREPGPAHIGLDVPARARELLSTPPTPARFDHLRTRLRYFESLLDVPGLEDETQEHHDRLRRVLAHPEIVSSFDAAHTDAELARVARLVEKRAFAMIRFDRGEIGGLMNPRVAHGRVIRPLFFALALGRFRGVPQLRIWDLEHPTPSQRCLRCLGRGADVLDAMEDAGDLYALFDFVMNFVESNRLGTPPRRFTRDHPGWSRFFDPRPLSAPPRSSAVPEARPALSLAEAREALQRLRP